MVQRGRCLRLSLKTGKRLRVAGNVLGKKFKGYKTPQPRIFCFVDDAHAAATKLLDDSVVRNRLSNH
jgi:hypothetical protein